LIRNAVDAMGPSETVTVRLDIADLKDELLRYEAIPAGKYAIVTVADNRPGIAAEHLDKIFEPFFTTKRVGEGTGLGLWVSYGIVKSFRGDITVKSEQGEGTSFCVTLPLHPEDYTYG